MSSLQDQLMKVGLSDVVEEVLPPAKQDYKKALKSKGVNTYAIADAQKLKSVYSVAKKFVVQGIRENRNMNEVVDEAITALYKNNHIENHGKIAAMLYKVKENLPKIKSLHRINYVNRCLRAANQQPNIPNDWKQWKKVKRNKACFLVMLFSMIIFILF